MNSHMFSCSSTLRWLYANSMVLLLSRAKWVSVSASVHGHAAVDGEGGRGDERRGGRGQEDEGGVELGLQPEPAEHGARRDVVEHGRGDLVGHLGGEVPGSQRVDADPPPAPPLRREVAG